MRKLFRSQFKVTQGFGENPDYYKQFGLKAHEGLDCIPTGSVWDVFALEDGIVVKDEDNARSGAYGVYVTIWSPTIKKALQYCHLASNSVSNGQQVKKGDVIGVMGSTGNSTGAHLHLNLFEVDDNGVRLNKNNGYLGGIDPLPFLQEQSDEQMAEITQKELDAIRTARDTHYNKTVEQEKTIAEQKQTIEKQTKDLKDTEQKLGQCLNITGELNEQDKHTSEQLIDEQKKNTELEKRIKELEKVKTPEPKVVYKNLPKSRLERLFLVFL